MNIETQRHKGTQTSTSSKAPQGTQCLSFALCTGASVSF